MYFFVFNGENKLTYLHFANVYFESNFRHDYVVWGCSGVFLDNFTEYKQLIMCNVLRDLVPFVQF